MPSYAHLVVDVIGAAEAGDHVLGRVSKVDAGVTVGKGDADTWLCFDGLEVVPKCLCQRLVGNGGRPGQQRWLSPVLTWGKEADERTVAPWFL